MVSVELVGSGFCLLDWLFAIFEFNAEEDSILINTNHQTEIRHFIKNEMVD